MQNLSLTEQTFSSLRQHNCIYVDKTDQIYQLLTKFSKAYFLARPRRFGKSLLVDTLDCIFQGRKELFEGLAISKTNYAWPVHPVVKLDFAQISKTTPTEFEAEFKNNLYQQAHTQGISMPADAPLSRLGVTLIQGLYEKYQAGVVILVDEYDKPILDVVEQPELANQMREVMRSFFDIIKPLSNFIRLTFITGVGRFSLAGFSSGLNHMDDLSVDARAATLLGYTQDEVQHYFNDYLQQYARNFEGGLPALLDEVKKWYNGYRFSDVDQRVYNPFSLMKFMQTGKFANYWFTTGTQTFLIKLMAQCDHWRDRFNAGKLTELLPEQLVIHEVNDLSPNALLFQTGYLTIKEVISGLARHRTDAFVLAYPNIEVQDSMHACLLTALTGIPNTQTTSILRKLNDALYTANIDDFLRTMQTNFARIPYQIHPTDSKERYYHSLFVAICQLLEFNTQAEVSTNRGRIDTVITTDTHIFIIEIKLDTPAQDALEQIKETQYAQSFAGKGKTVVLVGVSFDNTKRNIAHWVVDQI